MAIITPELSKKVGWINAGYIPYPTLEKVREATHYRLLQWYRFLPSPKNSEESKVLSIINYRVLNEHPAEIKDSKIIEAINKWKESC